MIRPTINMGVINAIQASTINYIELDGDYYSNRQHFSSFVLFNTFMSKNACSIGLFCTFFIHTEASQGGAKDNNVCFKNSSDLCLAQSKST